MVTISRYPYELWKKTGASSVKDDEGRWVEVPSGFEFLSVCRNQANGGGNEIMLSDGTAYVFSSVVYLPVGELYLQPGTEIEVRQGEFVRAEGKVIRFEKEQLHSRLWL